MRIEECINRVDSVKPNHYGVEEKVRWLSYLDASIKREIIDTHEQPVPAEENTIIVIGDGEITEEGSTEFNGYTPDDMTAELLVPFPFDELYVAYLKAKIDEENGETARYNNSAATFNGLLMDYEKAYNRDHMPIRKHMRIFKGVHI